MPTNNNPLTVRPLHRAVRHAFLYAAFPLTLSVSAAQAQTAPSSDATENTLPAVKVQGTQEPFPGDFAPAYGGGQVARGAKFGVLGNQEMINVPFSMTSYTSKAIEDQQAHSIGELLSHDPGVRPAFGFGNFSEVFVIRGFQLAGDDVSLNGLYGITPRQLVATEVLERVDVFKGANAFLNGASPTGSAIGGGINLELKRADDKPLTRVTVEGSGSGELGTHVDVGRRFGSEGQFGIRVNSAVRGGETSIDDEFRHNTSTAVSLDYRGDRLRLYGVGHRHRSADRAVRDTQLRAAVDAKHTRRHGRHRARRIRLSTRMDRVHERRHPPCARRRHVFVADVQFRHRHDGDARRHPAHDRCVVRRSRRAWALRDRTGHA